MMKYRFMLLVCCVVWRTSTYAKEESECFAQEDCGSCLRASGLCAFCKDESYTEGVNRQRPRCAYVSTLKDTKCKEYMNVQGTKKENDEKFTDTLQVIPKKVSLTLRPGLTQKFKLRVQPAKDFPVDIYYLMDMSRSMEDDLTNLRSLGTGIAKEISGITKNYKLAFGSFVDKTVDPFIQANRLDVPCKLSDLKTPCAKTFGYRHIFDFNKNGSLFENALKLQKISGNLDTPEGGFDGLMQVVACQGLLKWQSVDKARRIVIYVTDASPHIAGDGKIGGIIAPNDGQCHLKKVGDFYQYSKSNDQDYPSISLLKEKLEDQNIIPIMAVTEDVKDVYTKIAKDWSDLNAAIGMLKNDSSNIVHLIADKYRQIMKTLRPNAQAPEGIVVKFRATQCESVSENGEVCSDVVEDTEYVFDVSVMASWCPEDRSKWDETKSFTIKVPGYGNVEVDYKLICECDCESNSIDVGSKKCNSNGNTTCGMCYCDKGRHGDNCECDETTQADDTLCRHDNNTDSVCNGQGACVCGKCVCDLRAKANEIISGKFCECNNYSCDRFDGELCGGPSRGKCECGVCKCQEAYLGDNCGQDNCTLTSENCKINGEVCSGNGRCDCNVCVCKGGYDGNHCEDCVSCPGKCLKHKDCVQCMVWNEGEMYDSDPKCSQCQQLNIVVDDNTNSTCRYQNASGCWFQFSVDIVNGSHTILVERNKECVLVQSNNTPVLAIVLGVIGGLVLIALIMLLVWKQLITAYDNYEFQKFKKDTSTHPNIINPIYTSPQTNYVNPTFVGKVA